ncbi:MAG: hypothetical protein V2B13_06805 [Pseudomonadota bacterium]
MGIESITGTCQGKRWEVPLDMDFGNNIWKNREVKIMHGEKSFLPDELKVVELLNQFDHGVTKILRKIYWFESNSNQLEIIRHCLDKVYEKADQLNKYAGGSLVLKDLFRLRLGKIFSYAERINIESIRDKMDQSLWPEIKQSSVQRGAMREEDSYNLQLMETEINDLLDWRPRESVAQENEPPRLTEEETERIFESLTNLTFQGDQGEKEK